MTTGGQIPNIRIIFFPRIVNFFLEKPRRAYIYSYVKIFSLRLFSYKINPQTVVFVGYNDNYFGAREYNLTQNDRTLFVKLGYALAL